LDFEGLYKRAFDVSRYPVKWTGRGLNPRHLDFQSLKLTTQPDEFKLRRMGNALFAEAFSCAAVRMSIDASACIRAAKCRMAVGQNRAAGD
jgi:hypothetical protein